MPFSLYQRLSFSLLLMFVVIGSGVYIWTNHLDITARQQAEQSLHLSLAANLAHDNPLLQQGEYDQNALKNLFHTLMVLGPAFEFYLLDAKGKILTFSSTTQLVKQSVDTSPIIKLTHNQAQLPILGDDPKQNNKQKIFSAAPIFNGNQLTGYLYIIIGSQAYETALNKVVLTNRVEFSIILLIASSICLFFVMILLFRFFTNPLRQLSRDMKKLQATQFSLNDLTFKRWQQGSNNEVQQLGCVFIEMAEKINAQMKLQQQHDKQQRELLAHISHDLRTPLASLQGYLETIITPPKTDSKFQLAEYANIALKNAKQLKTLIDQIFEMAYLESGQISLTLEYFSITELLYDIAAKFDLKAKNNNISLLVDVNDTNAYVYSDIGKLERLLSNLIENALRHTPEKGVIILGLKKISDNRYLLTIADTGIGIEATELSYIFDARYRANNAIDDGQKHAGLGLTICKKLAAILHIKIDVKSELGKGTSFALTLQTEQ